MNETVYVDWIDFLILACFIIIPIGIVLAAALYYENLLSTKKTWLRKHGFSIYAQTDLVIHYKRGKKPSISAIYNIKEKFWLLSHEDKFGNIARLYEGKNMRRIYPFIIELIKDD